MRGYPGMSMARADAAQGPAEPVIGREQFAKISEVENIHLSEDAKRMFEEFDRQNLSHEERRRTIIERFRREAAE